MTDGKGIWKIKKIKNFTSKAVHYLGHNKKQNRNALVNKTLKCRIKNAECRIIMQNAEL